MTMPGSQDGNDQNIGASAENTHPQRGQGFFSKLFRYAQLRPWYIKTLYNEWAMSYDRQFSHNRWSGPERTAESVQAVFNLEADGLKILDVGIGTGMVSEEFRHINFDAHITGIDISSEMLEEARLKQAAHELIQHDFQKAGLPFDDESFDVVVSCGVFELLRRPDKVIREMGRVIRPSGAFALTVYSDSPESYGCIRHSDTLIEGALKDAGLGNFKKERFFAFYHHGNKIYYNMYSGLKQPN